MAVETPADLAAFFDTDEFGITVQIQPPGRLSYEVAGIFDQAYQAVLTIDDDVIESASPMFQCPSADLDQPAIDDLVVVSDIRYLVRNVQPDGTGVTKLILELE